MSRIAKFVAGLILIGAAVGIAAGWLWSSDAQAVERVTEHIRTVEIDKDSGDVVIRADDVSTTEIRESFSYRFDKPDSRAFSVDRGTLTLDGCGWWCTVDYEIVVPRGATVTGKLNSGNVELIGIAGGEIDINSGDTTLRDIGGPLTVDSDSGNIEATGLTGDLTVEANSGDVTASFDEPANVTADVDSGSIELTMPQAQYQVEGETDSGNRDIQVAVRDDATHRLQLDTDSGDVFVRMAS